MPEVAQGTELFTLLRRARGSLSVKVLRYGAGSILATVCSQSTFLVLYGPLGASTTVCSVLAWFAGAVPNYWVNRSWTWGRRGRPSLRRELVPYAAIILGTLVLAILATGAVAALLDGSSVSHGVRTVLVSGTYFLVYAVMFVFRFLLFDRLFAPREVLAEPDLAMRPRTLPKA